MKEAKFLFVIILICGILNSQNKHKKFLNITNITLSDYYSQRENGSTWDLKSDGFKPDIYPHIMLDNDMEKTVLNLSEKRYENLKTKTVAKWDTEVKINYNDINTLLVITFFDFDILTKDEVVNGTMLRKEQVLTEFNKDKGTFTFPSFGGFDFTMDYYWSSE